MSYQSLYRKYRPRNFSQVYGQKIAKKILINSLINQKISHAYLFFGPRGTGKTSLAKMFARICNCENAIKGECCEKCISCLTTNDKNCVDIVEIDAASNNGVDEIRELKSKINLTPNSLKYKVYIIDEVHMLSTGAFNALLKTLEEPPQHVIFILATTEYYKVPATIVSRCQTIEFSNIDNLSMKNRLLEICKLEKINVEEEAIEEIAQNSNGGLRDAIGLLDKAISFIDVNEKITKETIRELLGNISSKELTLFFEEMINENFDNVLMYTNNYCERGIDLVKLIDDLIVKFRDYMFEKNKYEYVEKIEILNNYQSKMKSSNNKDIMFQIMVLQLTNKTNVRFYEEKHSDNKEEKAKVVSERIKDNSYINIRINNSFVNADKKVLLDIKNNWKNLEKFTFDVEDGSIICDLIDCIPVVSSDKNLMLSSKYLAIVNKINENIEKYEKILKSKLNLCQKIIVVESKHWETLKENYLNNVKNNIKYNYIEEIKSENNDSNVNIQNTNNVQKAIELFGKID